jgi:hypothetical protein
MAKLTEPGLENKREDLSDLISIADAAATPFSTMIPKGKNLGNTRFDWHVDAYDAATSTGTVDGTDVDTTSGVDDPQVNMARLSNYGQLWRKAYRVSTLAEAANKAGAQSEVQRGLAKKMVELKRNIEKTLLSNNAEQADNGSNAYLTRGLGLWTDPALANATATLWVDADNAYRTPASSVETTASSSSLTDAHIQDVLKSIFEETGQVTSFNMFAGSLLRRAFSGLVANSVTVANAPTVVRTLNQDDNGTFTSTIDIFQGDYGTVHVHPDLFTPTTGTGYICPMDKLELRYGITPTAKPLTNNGGGEGKYVEAFGGLVVKNPLCFGKIVLSDGV